MNRKLEYRQALDKFVLRMEKRPDVIGILVSGSYIHSRIDKNSDIDVFVVTRNGSMRERGNTWIDNIEIEYFINPVKQVRNYFRTEVGDKSPCTAHMFANCNVLLKKDQIVDKLIREAKAIIQQKAPKMTKMDLELAKYFIDDMKKDMQDVYQKDSFAFHYVCNELLSYLLKQFFRLKQAKMEKNKRLLGQIKSFDPKFASLYSKAAVSSKSDSKYKAMLNLIHYTESLLGGRRSKEWKLRSKCT